MTSMQTNRVFLIGLGSVSMSRFNPRFCNKGLFKPMMNSYNFAKICASINSSSLDIKLSQNSTSNQFLKKIIFWNCGMYTTASEQRKCNFKLKTLRAWTVEVISHQKQRGKKKKEVKKKEKT